MFSGPFLWLLYNLPSVRDPISPCIVIVKAALLSSKHPVGCYFKRLSLKRNTQLFMYGPQLALSVFLILKLHIGRGCQLLWLTCEDIEIILVWECSKAFSNAH